jgi:hypothetical protein
VQLVDDLIEAKTGKAFQIKKTCAFLPCGKILKMERTQDKQVINITER